jgi:hypothetical protein
MDRKKARKKTRKEERKAKPAPGPMYDQAGRLKPRRKTIVLNTRVEDLIRVE